MTGLSLKNKINQIVSYCGAYDGHSSLYDERIENKSFNIKLPEEYRILQNLEKVNIILLTGEAGDGKSRILRNLKNEFEENGFAIIDDFSALHEDEKAEVIDTISKCLEDRSNSKVVIAANIGIFTKVLLSKEPSMLDEFTSNSKVLVINFEKRNLASSNMIENEALFSKIVKKFLEYNEEIPCDFDCIYYNNCPFKKNIDALRNDIVVENLRVLCDTLFLIGEHLTFRELLSLVSFMITSGYDCERLNNSMMQDITSLYYFNSIFEESQDILIQKFTKLDPVKKCSANDYQIFVKHGEDISNYKKAKRQIYFENKSECKYSELPMDYIDDFKRMLDKLHKPPYFSDVKEIRNVEEETYLENKTEKDLKKGFIKLISPQETNLEIVFYDTPPKIGEKIKTKFSINMNELNLIWNRADFDFDEIGKELNPFIDNNYFCLSCIYTDNDRNLKHISLNITYQLFRYIFMARDDVYFLTSNNVIEEFGLSDFFRAVLKAKPEFYDKMIVIFQDNKGEFCDFELSFYKKNELLFFNSSQSKVLIKKV